MTMTHRPHLTALAPTHPAVPRPTLYDWAADTVASGHLADVIVLDPELEPDSRPETLWDVSCPVCPSPQTYRILAPAGDRYPCAKCSTDLAVTPVPVVLA